MEQVFAVLVMILGLGCWHFSMRLTDKSPVWLMFVLQLVLRLLGLASVVLGVVWFWAIFK